MSVGRIMRKNKNLLNVCFALLLTLPVLSPANDQESYTVNTTAAELADSEGETGGQSSIYPRKPAEMSVDEIAKQLSNPVTALASFSTDIEYRTYQGSLPEAGDQTHFLFEFKPSIPIPLSNGKNILMRATIPVLGDVPVWSIPFGDPLWILDFDYPDFRLRQSPQITGESGEFIEVHSGLGDIGFDFAYGGVSDSGFISMYGLAAVMETATNISASRNKWLLGPEIALGKSAHWGVIGAWVTHLTNLTEGDYGYNTNETSIDVFFTYGLGNGWQVFSSPKIIYDWEADSGNELLLPIGAGISKTVKFGKVPVKFAFDIQKYIVSPDRFGTDLLVTFNLTPVFRNPFQK